MKLILLDYCPGGYGILTEGNSAKILARLREGVATGTVMVSLKGMVFTGVSLLEETIGALVGEIGEERVRRYVKFPDADAHDQYVIDRVLTNATEYFQKLMLEML